MPRGKRLDSQTKLERLNADIDELTERRSNIDEKIKELKEQKKSLETDLKAEQLGGLLDLIETSGLSIEDIEDLVSSSKSKPDAE